MSRTYRNRWWENDPEYQHPVKWLRTADVSCSCRMCSHRKQMKDYPRHKRMKYSDRKRYESENGM
jgi:uncharacterized protein VirK/YbjX